MLDKKGDTVLQSALLYKASKLFGNTNQGHQGVMGPRLRNGALDSPGMYLKGRRVGGRETRGSSQF